MSWKLVFTKQAQKDGEKIKQSGLESKVKDLLEMLKSDPFKSPPRYEKLKDLPKFENEDEEREFWSKHESTDYVDWSESDVAVFPKLKPTTKTISLRVPEYMLEELRTIANKRDVPYQSLIKIFLKERIDEELQTVD